MTTVNGLGELNEFGHAVDSNGNVQVDFVWGGFPLQPNDARGMATLDLSLDNHVVADIGWSNFPGYIPNYSGDEDSQLEAVIPTFRGLQWNAVQNALTEVGLGNTISWQYPVIQAISSTGKTATLTIDDVYGFAPGDIISGSYNDGNGVSGTFTDAKVKSVNGTQLVLTLKTAISPALAITNAAGGSSLFVNYVSGNDTRYVLGANYAEGDIVNIGTTVTLNVIIDND